jgi:hypothetical protein
MIWRLYYEDGSTFDDADGRPHDSPPWGVVALAQPGSQPPVFVNADYYLYRDDLGEWTECGDVIGLVDHLTHRADKISAVRAGRWIPTKPFKDIWARARADCGVK